MLASREPLCYAALTRVSGAGFPAPSWRLGENHERKRGAERVELSTGNQGSSIQASLAGRYATALFDVATETRAIEAVAASWAYSPATAA